MDDSGIKLEMKNKDKTREEVASLKKEVGYLKERLNSVSESELSRNIETQKLKIHDIERTKIGISWLFHESKKSGMVSLSLPFLLAIIAFSFAHYILGGILQGQTEVLQMLGDVGFDLTPMLNMIPLLVFILAYVSGFKITYLVAGIIVKRGVLKREKNKLRMLESK